MNNNDKKLLAKLAIHHIVTVGEDKDGVKMTNIFGINSIHKDPANPLSQGGLILRIVNSGGNKYNKFLTQEDKNNLQSIFYKGNKDKTSTYLKLDLLKIYSHEFEKLMLEALEEKRYESKFENMLSVYKKKYINKYKLLINSSSYSHNSPKKIVSYKKSSSFQTKLVQFIDAAKKLNLDDGDQITIIKVKDKIIINLSDC